MCHKLRSVTCSSADLSDHCPPEIKTLKNFQLSGTNLVPDPPTIFIIFGQAVMNEIRLCKRETRNDKGRRMAKRKETFWTQEDIFK